MASWLSSSSPGPHAANKLSEFYCRVCRKDVSVPSDGRYEIIRHFQGYHHLARDQRLRLETPGWRVLDFDGNPLLEDELERQREKITLAPLWSGTENIVFGKTRFRMRQEMWMHSCQCWRKSHFS